MADTATVFPGSFVGFDDNERTFGSNGYAPSGIQVARFADALNSIAHSPRMVRTFWGGTSTNDSSTLRKFAWIQQHAPALALNGELLVLQCNSTRSASQGVFTNIDAEGTTTYAMDYDMENQTAHTAPINLERFSFSQARTSQGSHTFDVGSATSNGPYLIAGMFYEPANHATDPTVANRYTPSEHAAPGMDIVSVAPSSGKNHLDTLRANFLHTWNRKRPGIGWEMQNAGTNYVEFSTSSQEYRFIFDQSIGDGGTTPSTTGMGLTFPLYCAGSGINTTVKMALWVYAWMDGATDTGKVGVSHKAAGGSSMTSIADVVTGISGTTPTWYPTSGVSTFDARTDLSFERFVLCGKSGGATDKLRIGAFYMQPVPSQNIT